METMTVPEFNPLLPPVLGDVKKSRGAMPLCTPLATRGTPRPSWERTTESILLHHDDTQPKGRITCARDTLGKNTLHLF
jgi:hypothetical protein